MSGGLGSEVRYKHTNTFHGWVMVDTLPCVWCNHCDVFGLFSIRMVVSSGCSFHICRALCLGRQGARGSKYAVGIFWDTHSIIWYCLKTVSRRRGVLCQVRLGQVDVARMLGIPNFPGNKPLLGNWKKKKKKRKKKGGKIKQGFIKHVYLLYILLAIIFPCVISVLSFLVPGPLWNVLGCTEQCQSNDMYM